VLLVVDMLLLVLPPLPSVVVVVDALSVVEEVEPPAPELLVVPVEVEPALVEVLLVVSVEDDVAELVVLELVPPPELLLSAADVLVLDPVVLEDVLEAAEAVETVLVGPVAVIAVSPPEGPVGPATVLAVLFEPSSTEGEVSTTLAQLAASSVAQAHQNTNSGLFTHSSPTSYSGGIKSQVGGTEPGYARPLGLGGPRCSLRAASLAS
jgi:hypothetical protein